MNICWYLFSFLYSQMCNARDFVESPDAIFGKRTMYVKEPTQIMTSNSPFLFEELGRNGNKKKWEIKYLSREDARKLISTSPESQGTQRPAEFEKKSLDVVSLKTRQDTPSKQSRRKFSQINTEKPTFETGSSSWQKTARKTTPRLEETSERPLSLPFKSNNENHPLEKSEQRQVEPNRKGAENLPTKTSEDVLQPAFTTEMTSASLLDDGNAFTSTEGMEVISSTSADRLALLKDRQRDGPQLIFLADDPEAASRIPELLTTLYDVGSSTKRVKPGLYGTHPGIITESNQEEVDEYTVDPQSVQLTPVIATDRHEDDRERHLNDAFDKKAYFPSRHRPSYTKPQPHRTKGYSSKLKMARVTNIEAECREDYMRIQIRLNGSFNGLVYSSGYSHNLDCVYINGSGRSVYEFYIKLNRCGTLGSNQLQDTRKPMHKNVMWNTLTVQYNPLIEEEWDEHFKVTCEYGLEIWKTVTFPFLDVEVQTGNPMLFTLSPPECHMEIRLGFDPSGPKVTSPVRVGDPLTLVIYMRSQYDGFDIVISDCFAHNGGTKTILLIDSYGCPVDDKLISHFEGQSLRDGAFETQVFAFMKTFRFTGSPALYIECGVRMCHGDCPSQQCHWRYSRASLKRSRRSVNQEITTTTTTSPREANVSESVHLFQALQVIRDDVEPLASPPLVEAGELCFKLNHLGIGAGIVVGLLSLVILGLIKLCIRMRNYPKDLPGPVSPTAPIHPTYKSEYVHSSKRCLE